MFKKHTFKSLLIIILTIFLLTIFFSSCDSEQPNDSSGKEDNTTDSKSSSGNDSQSNSNNNKESNNENDSVSEKDKSENNTDSTTSTGNTSDNNKFWIGSYTSLEQGLDESVPSLGIGLVEVPVKKKLELNKDNTFVIKYGSKKITGTIMDNNDGTLTLVTKNGNKIEISPEKKEDKVSFIMKIEKKDVLFSSDKDNK